MAKVAMVIFSALTAGAGAMTYYNIGLEDQQISSESSVRQGSHGGRFSSGGFRSGK